jgi:hypothetical protein
MGWTQQEMVDFCDRKKILRTSYSFYADRDDAFCMDVVGLEWRIYYSERGTKNELAWAKSEEQALNILKLFLLEANKLI